MSESPKDELAFVILQIEMQKGRRLSDKERLAWETANKKTIRLLYEEYQRKPSKWSQIARKRKSASFSEKLKTRQGTIMPDFEALYKKKADIDRRLSDP